MVSFRESPPRPFLKWVGGKRQLIPELLQAVEATSPFRHYHEPFLGGGALFFALARTDRLNASSYLSDANRNLIDTYLAVRDEVQRVIELLEEYKHHHSEAFFYQIRATAPRALAKRAARIIYLNKTCYNGLYRENSKGQFNAPFGRYKNPKICDADNLRAVSQTLQEADIAVRDFSSVLDVTQPDDLVYFDPPYNPVSKTANFTAYFRRGFETDAQQRLAEVCAILAARGVKVVISNSMTDLTRSLYKDFHIYEVMANRNVNSRADRRGKVSEALITNFPMRLKERSRVNGRVASPAMASGEIERMRAKQWLLQNEYEDVAALIDEVMDEWKAEGKHTRRNWWEILAGDLKGNPRVVAGREFPVLRAAQVRQGVPVTPNAISRDPDAETLSVRVTGRRQKSS
jgi:DNA adenine methylase